MFVAGVGPGILIINPVLLCPLAHVPVFRDRPRRQRYYHCWLAALERLVTAKGLCEAPALVARKEAWAEAYRHTPHGQPVELPAPAGDPVNST